MMRHTSAVRAGRSHELAIEQLRTLTHHQGMLEHNLDSFVQYLKELT